MRCVVTCAALLLLAGGCVNPRVVPGGVVTGTSRVGWASKDVVQKQEPETLLARDGTICRVSPDRFKGTAVGDRIDCNWQ